jgi:hypothetical protein
MSGTTQEWLQKALTERDIYGGFANRWCYFTGQSKEPMANPQKVDEEKRNELVRELNKIRDWADKVPNKEIKKSDDALVLFKEYYDTSYYLRCQQSGLIPTLIERVQNFIWKIALLYAANDLSETISKEHMEAAIKVGNYLEASVARVFADFGDSKGKRAETRVFGYLKSIGEPIGYRDVYHNLNLSGKELDEAIQPLLKVGMIKNHYDGKKRMLEAI